MQVPLHAMTASLACSARSRAFQRTCHQAQATAAPAGEVGATQALTNREPSSEDPPRPGAADDGLLPVEPGDRQRPVPACGHRQGHVTYILANLGVKPRTPAGPAGVSVASVMQCPGLTPSSDW